MKKLFLFLMLSAFILNCYAQQSKPVKVPDAVKKTFTAQFPKASEVKWQSEKAGEFEAEFELNEIEMSAKLDEKGNLLETESPVNESDLPKGVKTAFAKDFKGYQINEASKVLSKGITSFEIQAEKNNETIELVYDSNGKLLKKEEGKAGGEGEE